MKPLLTATYTAVDKSLGDRAVTITWFDDDSCDVKAVGAVDDIELKMLCAAGGKRLRNWSCDCRLGGPPA